MVQRQLLLVAYFVFAVVVHGAKIPNVTINQKNVTIYHYAPEIWCDPVAPTPTKEKTLALFRQENYSVPVVFWHLQKAGGSTICSLLLNSFARTLKRPELRKIYEWHTNCNNPEMIADVVKSPTAFSDKYRPRGKFFAAMEPSHADRIRKTDPVIDPNLFPFKYHDQPHVRRLLGVEEPGPGPTSETPAWTNAVHVIGLRHPLDMAMSAFQYIFQPDRFSMLDRCHAWNMTVNECVTAALDLLDQPPEESPLHPVYEHYRGVRTKDASAVNTTAYYIELEDIITRANTVPLSSVHAHVNLDPHLLHLNGTFNDTSADTAPPAARRRLISYVSPLDMAPVEATLGNIRNYERQMAELKKSFHRGKGKGRRKAAATPTTPAKPAAPAVLAASAASAAPAAAAASPVAASAAAAAVHMTAASVPSPSSSRRRLSAADAAPISAALTPTKLPLWWQRLLSQPLFDVWQQHRIRHQVFGNYSIQHLAVNNQLATAKQNLRKFMLIVDVTFAEESARLISSTLGWVHVARLSQKRKALGGKNPFGVMRRSTAELLAQLDSAVLDRMKRHLRHELELYEYGMSLMLDHYRSVYSCLSKKNDARRLKERGKREKKTTI